MVNPEPVLDGATVTKRLLDASSTCTETRLESPTHWHYLHVERCIEFEIYSPRVAITLFEEGLSTERRIVQAERQAHHDLKRDGCRPMISIDLIERAIHDQESLEARLIPWNIGWYHGAGGDSLILDNRSVLQRQQVRWRDFREWQHQSRALRSPQNEAFGDYFWTRRRIDEAGGLRLRPETLPLYVDHTRSSWTQEEALREKRCRIWPERRCLSLDQHANDVQSRLNRYICDAAFAPSTDPSKQDELTTWIKYLSFELWWLENWMEEHQKLQEQHDESWLLLYLMQCVLSDDTAEELASHALAIEQLDQANKDVEEATEAIEAINKVTKSEPWASMITQQEESALVSKWVEALNEAKMRQDLAIDSVDKLSAFSEQHRALDENKQKLDHQEQLVEWIVSQIEGVKYSIQGKSDTIPGASNSPG